MNLNVTFVFLLMFWMVGFNSTSSIWSSRRLSISTCTVNPLSTQTLMAYHFLFYSAFNYDLKGLFLRSTCLNRVFFLFCINFFIRSRHYHTICTSAHSACFNVRQKFHAFFYPLLKRLILQNATSWAMWKLRNRNCSPLGPNVSSVRTHILTLTYEILYA